MQKQEAKHQRKRTLRQKIKEALSHFESWLPVRSLRYVYLIIAICVVGAFLSRRLEALWNPVGILILSVVKWTLCVASSAAECLLVFIRHRIPKHKPPILLEIMGALLPFTIAFFLSPFPDISTKQIELVRAFNSQTTKAGQTPGIETIARGLELSHLDPLEVAQGKLALGKIAEAIPLINEGMTGPTRQLAEAHLNKSRALWALGKYPEALVEAESALSLIPDYAPAYVVKCSVLRHLGQFVEAMKACKKAISIDASVNFAWNDSCAVYLELRDYNNALAACEIGLRRNPKIPQLWNDKAIALHYMGQNEEALDAANEALALAPEFSDALLNKGTILKSLNRIQEAAAIYQRLVNANPNDAEAWNNLGDALEDAGHLQESLTPYRAALQIKPDYETALYNMGEVLNRLGRFGDSQQFLEHACAIDPKDDDALFQLALAQAKTSQKRKALITLSRTLIANPKNSRAQSLRQALLSGQALP